MSKVWLVTGANSGIGEGIAKAALRAGDQVVATARNMDKLRAAFAGEDTSAAIALVQLDVSDADQAAAAIAQAAPGKRPATVGDRGCVKTQTRRISVQQYTIHGFLRFPWRIRIPTMTLVVKIYCAVTSRSCLLHSLNP